MVSLTAESFDQMMRVNWREPRSLRRSDKAADYPVGCFPPVARAAIREMAEFVQAPEALIAGCVLTAISASVQTHFSIQRDAVLKGPASLFVLTIAESGERKSTVDRLVMKPLKDWEARQALIANAEEAQYLNELRGWENQEDRDEADRPKRPRVPRMIRGEDTSEALIIAISEYPVAAVISAEAGVIFGSTNMSPERVMANLAQANAMWDGGPIDQGRVSRARVRIEHMRVTMGLQIQPSALDRFSEKNGSLARGIGFLARFLMCQPESTQGSRYYQDPPEHTPKLAAFHARITEMLLAPAQFDENDQLLSHHVQLSPEARRTWIAFHDEVEERINPDHEYAEVREVASKAAENAARIACCFHVFANGAHTDIGHEIMSQACSLMRWYLDEAIRFARKYSETEEVQNAEQLEAWLVGHHKKLARQKAADTLTVNMVRQLGPNRLRVRSRADAAIQLLQDHGRIRVQKVHGSKPEYIQIAPQVLAEWD